MQDSPRTGPPSVGRTRRALTMYPLRRYDGFLNSTQYPVPVPSAGTLNSKPRTRPGVLETDSLSFPTPPRQAFGGQAPGWRRAALMTSLRPSQTGGRSHPEAHLLGTDTEAKGLSVPVSET